MVIVGLTAGSSETLRLCACWVVVLPSPPQLKMQQDLGPLHHVGWWWCCVNMFCKSGRERCLCGAAVARLVVPLQLSVGQ